MGLPTEVNEAGSITKKISYNALNGVTQVNSGDESLKTGAKYKKIILIFLKDTHYYFLEERG